jgi:hypothetical protein
VLAALSARARLDPGWTQAGKVTMGALGGTGASTRREPRRIRAGSAALAPAAHGELPPERYPVQRRLRLATGHAR